MRTGQWVFLLTAILTLAVAYPVESATRTLYLVRHGQYDFRDESDPDVGKALIPIGVAQAKLVANRLHGLPVSMTALRSSTMTRARQTAKVIGQDFPGLEIVQSRMLRECIPPTWRKDILETYGPDEIQECKEQLEASFEEFFVPSEDQDRHEILVCHGNVIRYFVTRVLGVDPMAWLGMSVGNCSLTVVRVNSDGTMKLLSVGDLGHLPPNLQTGLDRVERNLKVPGD